MYNRAMFRRHAESAVEDSLQDTPVTLIMGPRQVGKSTLVMRFSTRERPYVTLDDPHILAAARLNPGQFLVDHGTPLIVDEVQRAPELLLAVKLAVDRNRRPGMYLLTASANVLVMPKVADSLAGRMEPIDLLPLTQAEIEGQDRNPVVDRWFDPDFDARALSCDACLAADVADRILTGGFPEPVSRSSAARRDAWFAAYVRTILDRDVRDLANIDGLTQMPRLLALVASRTGDSLNVSSLSRSSGIAQTTLTRYLDLLRALFLIQTVPAWSIDRDHRFTKTPKAYVVDSGLLGHLCRADARALLADRALLGQALENFVANELQRQILTSKVRPWLMHLRTVKQKQVNFVLEAPDGRIVGIEVRPTAVVGDADVEGLRFLSELAGERFVRGIVLDLGQEARVVGPSLLALPISSLWSL